jgi:hypothetical protein
MVGSMFEVLSFRFSLAVASADYAGGMYRFCGIWRRDTLPEPAASWLLQHPIELAAGNVDIPGAPDV